VRGQRGRPGGAGRAGAPPPHGARRGWRRLRRRQRRASCHHAAHPGARHPRPLPSHPPPPPRVHIINEVMLPKDLTTPLRELRKTVKVRRPGGLAGTAALRAWAAPGLPCRPGIPRACLPAARPPSAHASPLLCALLPRSARRAGGSSSERARPPLLRLTDGAALFSLAPATMPDPKCMGRRRTLLARRSPPPSHQPVPRGTPG
jgi:hypothetical protein